MTSVKSGSRVTGLVFNPWNLLLLVPFVLLITPLYNRTEPELLGMPFFYWFQFAAVPLSVLMTVIVYRMTRTGRPVPPPAAEPDVDELDEGSSR
jgi:Protein of unknown function (DUF3311)